MTQGRPHLSRGASLLAASALAWGIALIAAAVVVPVWSSESSSVSVSTSGAHLVTTSHATSSTFVQEQGDWMLLAVGIPALIAACVWMALRRKCSHGSRASGALAWTLIGALGVLSVLGILTIGVFIAPVFVLLAIAASLTAPAASPRAGNAV